MDCVLSSTSRSTLVLSPVLGSLYWDIWCKILQDCMRCVTKRALVLLSRLLGIANGADSPYLALHGLATGPSIALVVHMLSLGSRRGQLISMVRSKLLAKPSAVRRGTEHLEKPRSRSPSYQCIDSIGFQMHAVYSYHRLISLANGT